MTETTLFGAGQGSRERWRVDMCPFCLSEDLVFNQRESTRDLVRCKNCWAVFSKGSLQQRRSNRW